MEFELKKKLIVIGHRFFAGICLLFCVLGFFNVDNWKYRILMLASLSLVMLLVGMENIVFQRTKSHRYVYFLLSAAILGAAIHTIIIGNTTGKL